MESEMRHMSDKFIGFILLEDADRHIICLIRTICLVNY